jgi:cytochrome c oxidase subunit IV
MTFSGDQWGRPQPPTPPPDQPAPQRRGIGAIGCYLVVVGFLVVATVISFVVSAHSTSHLMAWLLLTLTVLLVIVPLLLRNIVRAARRRDE